MKERVVRCTKLMAIAISLLISLCSCNKSVDNTSKSIEFEKLYSGFIMCGSEDMTKSYEMSNFYIITNEKDWEKWSNKYTKQFPYYQDEFDWDQYCLIADAWIGAKDFCNTISEIDELYFDKDGNLTITYDSNPESDTYAFNTTDIRHVAIQVIKIKKSDLPSNVPSSYYEYSTALN